MLDRVDLTKTTSADAKAFVESHPYMADDKLPQARTNWPQKRNKQAYLQLHHPKQLRNYQQAELMLTVSSAPKTILDAGLGYGIAIAEFKSEHTITIGVGLDPILPENAAKIDCLCYSAIPDGQAARQLFEKLRGCVDNVFDTFGPGTYAANPVHALIYLGLLLSAGGEANIIISSIYGEPVDQSPIGYAATRRKLMAFFRQELNLDIMITRTILQSELQADVVCKDFHVKIKRAENAPACMKSLDELFALADHLFGKPVRLPKSNGWGNFDTGFKIQGRAYGADNQPHHWQTAITQVQMDYVIQQGIGVRFHLQFDNALSLSEFNTQFSEFFVCHADADWQIKTFAPEEAATIIYYSVTTDARVIQHQAAYQNDSLPAFTAVDVPECVLEAKQQLQQALDEIPGINTLQGKELTAVLTPVSIYSRTSGIGLFKPPFIAREVERKQQYPCQKIL